MGNIRQFAVMPYIRVRRIRLDSVSPGPTSCRPQGASGGFAVEQQDFWPGDTTSDEYKVLVANRCDAAALAPAPPALTFGGSDDAVIPHLAIDRRPLHPQGYRRLQLVVGVVLQAADNGVSLKRLHLGELALRKRSTLGWQLVGTDDA